MAYEFIDYLKPAGTAKFALLEDVFLKGGFRVVNKLSDLDTLDRTVVKVGMLVSVVEEDGSLYKCTEFRQEEDEFGDVVVVSKFEPYSVEPKEKEVKEHKRLVKTIRFSYSEPGEIVDVPVDMKCKSFVVVGIRVSMNRKVKVRVFSTSDKTDHMPYTFISDRLNFDDGTTYLADGTKFAYKKYKMVVNEALIPTNRTFFVFECTSNEDAEYMFDRELSLTEIELRLTYIPLET